MSITEFLLVVSAILIGAKLMGELAERLGQPAVLGELIAGVLLGASVFSVVDPGNEVVHLFAELGVIILLFEIGLETDLKKLMATGGAAAAVAVVGVALPFFFGFVVGELFGLQTLTAMVMAAALTATSVGITARVLADLRRLHEPEGQIVLGAAVIDDVLGLIILSVVAGIVAGGSVTLAGVAITTIKAFAFIAVVLLAGRLIVPPLFRQLHRVSNDQTIAVMGLVLAFLLALLAEKAGSALIIGAFVAGLALQPSAQAKVIEAGVVRLGHFFVPIFFVVVGAAVDVRTFAQPLVLGLGVALTVVAIVGKVAAGYAPWWFKGRKFVVGVAMVPRGEVGLIFAQTGLTAGVLNTGEFSAVMVMVMATTFVAPIALKRLLTRSSDEVECIAGGVSDLTNEA
jgi:Kef-type K+ transport system membrane component KefB